MLAINQLLLKERFYINACLHRSSFLVLLRDECMVHSHSPLGVSLNAFNFLTRMSRSKLAREVNFPMEVAEAGRIPATR